MESCNIDAAQLTRNSTYNVEDRTLVAEFMDNDEWLEEGEEEFWITNEEVERNDTVQVDL